MGYRQRAGLCRPRMGQYAESGFEPRWRKRCEWFQYRVLGALLDRWLHRSFWTCNHLVRRANYLNAADRRSEQLTNRHGLSLDYPGPPSEGQSLGGERP